MNKEVASGTRRERQIGWAVLEMPQGRHLKRFLVMLWEPKRKQQSGRVLRGCMQCDEMQSPGRSVITTLSD